MAKFKVGDMVKVINYKDITPYCSIKIGDCGVVLEDRGVGYMVYFNKEDMMLFFLEQNLKLVEPKKEEPKHDKAFDLDPHEFEKTKTPFSDIDDSIKYILKSIESPYIPLEYKILNGSVRSGKDMSMFNRFSHLFGNPTFNTKNRIPDRVVFNADKGKVTVLISKFNDGVAPYRAYTSKVNVESGDKYDGYFGFFLSYYKYLNRHLDSATRKELIDMAFEHGEHKEYIIEGAVSQEVLKLVKLDEWDNILDAILDVSKQNKGYWDHLEWKEMLRVHELETKREKQREVQKEIKKHQKAIEELKKKEV
jgi:hypothetical protein